MYVIIGISGVTNGGKSSLSHKLKEKWPSSIVLHGDDYYKTQEKLHYFPDVDYHNWDEIDSFDWKKLKQDINQYIILRNLDLNLENSDDIKNVSIRRYNSVVYTIPLVIVEGILLFNVPDINKFFDLRFFLTLTKRQCWDRRRKRIYEPPEPISYFEKYCWPSYILYKNLIVKTKSKIHIRYLDGSKNLDKLVRDITGDLVSYIKQKSKQIIEK